MGWWPIPSYPILLLTSFFLTSLVQILDLWGRRSKKVQNLNKWSYNYNTVYTGKSWSVKFTINSLPVTPFDASLRNQGLNSAGNMWIYWKVPHILSTEFLISFSSSPPSSGSVKMGHVFGSWSENQNDQILVSKFPFWGWHMTPYLERNIFLLLQWIAWVECHPVHWDLEKQCGNKVCLFGIINKQYM